MASFHGTARPETENGNEDQRQRETVNMISLRCNSESFLGTKITDIVESGGRVDWNSCAVVVTELRRFLRMRNIIARPSIEQLEAQGGYILHMFSLHGDDATYEERVRQTLVERLRTRLTSELRSLRKDRWLVGKEGEWREGTAWWGSWKWNGVMERRINEDQETGTEQDGVGSRKKNMNEEKSVGEVEGESQDQGGSVDLDQPQTPLRRAIGVLSRLQQAFSQPRRSSMQRQDWSHLSNDQPGEGERATTNAITYPELPPRPEMEEADGCTSTHNVTSLFARQVNLNSDQSGGPGEPEPPGRPGSDLDAERCQFGGKATGIRRHPEMSTMDSPPKPSSPPSSGKGDDGATGRSKTSLAKDWYFPHKTLDRRTTGAAHDETERAPRTVRRIFEPRTPTRTSSPAPKRAVGGVGFPSIPLVDAFPQIQHATQRRRSCLVRLREHHERHEAAIANLTTRPRTDTITQRQGIRAELNQLQSEVDAETTEYATAASEELGLADSSASECMKEHQSAFEQLVV
ncbi:hypothetical protein K490DRAFT_59051 [Saccharata proteae CBS 121410]|uniref:Uncharacterized protein n=1 Tax=Saccharata proteae CBS 121410 TaxID=1314787 RepID=A0A9P4LWG3_9PEZI|nr:hypothetical protein K490DRAFT_59051 [Saccharata proteae CBS 121410]